MVEIGIGSLGTKWDAHHFSDKVISCLSILRDRVQGCRERDGRVGPCWQGQIPGLRNSRCVLEGQVTEAGQIPKLFELRSY